MGMGVGKEEIESAFSLLLLLCVFCWWFYEFDGVLC